MPGWTRSRLGERGTPRLAAVQVTAVLKRHGFALVGQSGSHQKWRNPATSKQVIVAQHKGKVLPLGTMRSIIAGSGLSLDEWQR
jgi:predicted RNA binding protein YcfA (HicA-like mRNA interferase family)